MASLSSRSARSVPVAGMEGVEDGEEVAHLVEGSGVTRVSASTIARRAGFAERGVDPGAPPQGSKLSGQVHSPPSDQPRIMCYGSRVAVLISVDVFRRLMGHLKPIQALFVFRVVSTRVINAAA
ncbi:hypothetical protein [Micromonospora schwarzwaldensis]|uniref:hypothetical protein n=1 Tax=Micromonospora sp. DSM 45708 TaxID=3111767 RepID=UPI0031D0A5D5